MHDTQRSQVRAYVRAGEAYKSTQLASQIFAATPHQLVMLLYREMMTSLEILETALRSDNPVMANVQFTKIQSILHALAAGLDFESGGNLAHSLASLYRMLQSQLFTRSIESIREVRINVAEIASAWEKIGQHSGG